MKIREELKVQPYQERVVIEKRELDEKIQKLKAFIAERSFCEPLEFARLARQLTYMELYSAVLGDRVAAF